MSNELARTLTTGAPSRRWVAAMAATALAATVALALSIAAILAAGSPPAVIGPEVATPAPLVRVTPAQERRIEQWYRCVAAAPTLAASAKCLPGAGA
jgi:hypothetical protein